MKLVIKWMQALTLVTVIGVHSAYATPEGIQRIDAPGMVIPLRSDSTLALFVTGQAAKKISANLDSNEVCYGEDYCLIGHLTENGVVTEWNDFYKNPSVLGSTTRFTDVESFYEFFISATRPQNIPESNIMKKWAGEINATSYTCEELEPYTEVIITGRAAENLYNFLEPDSRKGSLVGCSRTAQYQAYDLEIDIQRGGFVPKDGAKISHYHYQCHVRLNSKIGKIIPRDTDACIFRSKQISAGGKE